jgi:hypothetical protein
MASVYTVSTNELGSLPYSQPALTDPYPEPHKSNPHPPKPICLGSILKLSFHRVIYLQNFVRISYRPHARYMPRPSHSP